MPTLTAAITELNRETPDGSYDTIRVTDADGAEVFSDAIPSTDDPAAYDRVLRAAGIRDYQWAEQSR